MNIDFESSTDQILKEIMEAIEQSDSFNG
jgi:hypothetical protein